MALIPNQVERGIEFVLVLGGEAIVDASHKHKHRNLQATEPLRRI